MVEVLGVWGERSGTILCHLLRSEKKMKGRQKEAVTPCGRQAGKDVKHVASQSMSWRE